MEESGRVLGWRLGFFFNDAATTEIYTLSLPGALPISASVVCSIAQFGSTRSINAGVASGIAMHAWIRRHAHTQPGPGEV